LKAFNYFLEMKWKKSIIEFLKRFLVIFSGLVIIYTLFDLWVPMKRIIGGERLLFDEIVAYIQFTGHWLIIYAISIGVSLSETRRLLKNPSRQSDQRPAKKRTKQI